jgi:hypothetical protein
MEEKMFAFGDTELDNTVCVARAAGFKVTGKLLTVAEAYDAEAETRYDLGEGLLTKSVAESCWLDAIEYLRENARQYEGKDMEHANYLYDAADKGEEIHSIVF